MTHTLSVKSSTPLGHCWGIGNRLLVYSHSSLSSKKSNDAYVHEVRWDVSLISNEFTRRLIRTSFDVFCSLQKNSDPERYLSFSRQYRAILAMCSQEILHFLKLRSDMDEAKALHLASQYDLIERLELVWHLAELIFIQAFPVGHLAYNLCSWFHLQHQEAVDDARALIENACSTPNPNPLQCTVLEKDERFWPTVLTLVLQARSLDAASVLAMHSHSNSRALRCLRQLLVAMPIDSPTKSKELWNKSGATFPQVWNYWQSECIQRLSNGEFDQASLDDESAQHIVLILSILAGHPESWEDERIIRASGGPRAWYFRFVSFLFYTEQLATVEDLSDHLDRWFTITCNPPFEVNSNTDQVIDALITSVFRLDFQTFIRCASEKLESWWLVAHFTNLMHHVYPDVLQASGPTECDENVVCVKPEDLGNRSETELSRSSASSLPEFFILNYAASLASDLSLLSVALGYFDYCEAGAGRQKGFLLAHGYPVSTRSMNWFIAQAQRRRLVDASEQLARGFSRRFLLCSLRNNAPTDYPDTLSLVCPLSLTTLGWALLGRDYGVVNRLIEQALSRDRGLLADRSNTSTEISELAAAVLGFHHDGQLPESVTNFTSNGTKKSPLSPELAFLIRYAELQQCFIVGNEELAVDRMIELLVTTSGGFAPLAHPSSMGTSIPDIGSAISTRLRLRLLSEVRHLLGRNCIRRDQVELLIASLVDIRFELQHSSYENQESISLLSRLHMLLARELASSVLPSNHSTVVLPSAIHPN